MIALLLESFSDWKIHFKNGMHYCIVKLVLILLSIQILPSQEIKLKCSLHQEFHIST